MATDEEVKQNQNPEEEQDIASMNSDSIENGQINETTIQSQKDTDDKPSEDIQDEILDDTTQKKAKSINKILFIAIGALVSIILIIMILFFIGVFDPKVEAPPPVDPNDPTAVVVVEPVIPEIPTYNFQMSDINEERLNNKLSLLKNNKPPIVSDVEVKKQSLNQEIENKDNNAFYDEELESLFAEQPTVEITDNQENIENTSLQEALTNEIVDNNVDENQLLANSITETNTKVEDEAKIETDIKIKDEEIKIDPIYNNQFLKFIQVATLKYKLYTQFLREIKAVDARISICQNEQGRIQIFIGPFLDDGQRSFVLEKINKSVVTDAFALEFTQEEFYKRCGINDPS
ncbi:MAG: hypothetical protein RBR07_02640 [Arcobacteraceae bacterium]|nr:hypothetical protein [Arcobacteraceae bacterium]